MKNPNPTLLGTLASLLLFGCYEPPQGITPVQGFQVERYLGTWYEIARFDHSFERGLDSVTANYTMRKDGGVRVLNRGFNTEKGKWKDAEGRAYFVGSPTVGHLKVSFFRPFYGGYVIFALDSNYTQSYVTSGKDYLWLLSRTPSISDSARRSFTTQVSGLGYDTTRLLWIPQ